MSYSLQEFQSIKIYHRADQGPCPRGFHIGSKAEWQSLIDALTTLGVYNVSTIPTVLNIPSAYYLARSNGALETRYGIARYWTSTMESNTIAWAWGIDENNSLVFQQDKPGNAFSVRPFKDEPVIPDSSWTESPSGIFKNTTLGLISIQNGSNWITISDKNLGATNVGDDGLYYQFGNNYGFTVSPTTYYTSKVSNTQAYGPSNYYNDDHFVRVSSGNNWFTDTNNNIRGGVDTTSLYPTEAKEVWLGNNKVRPAGWTPGANTIAYYPFKSDMLDYSGNNNHWTSGTGTFANNMITTTSNLSRNSLVSNTSMDFTLTAWVDESKTSSNAGYAMIAPHANTDGPSVGIWVNRSDGYIAGALTNTWVIPASQSLTGIHCIHFTKDGSTFKVYVDGVLKGTSTNSNSLRSASIARIGGTNSNYYSVTCGNVILENKARTAQEVSDYYNLTKGDYGL